jgi:hypothetical protein
MAKKFKKVKPDKADCQWPEFFQTKTQHISISLGAGKIDKNARVYPQVLLEKAMKDYMDTHPIIMSHLVKL